MKKRADRYPLFQRLSPGGADVSGVTATAPDVDEGKVFVDSSGEQVVGTSTYKADYISLSTDIDNLNDTLEPVLLGDGSDTNVYANVSNVTAIASDVAQGKVFVNSSGVETTGTASGGSSTADLISMIERDTSANITIPNGTTKIGYGVFEEWEGFTNVNIPSNVTTIDEIAFRYCTLQSLSFGNGEINIGSSAFRGCRSLQSISFGNGEINFDSSAFKGCTSLVTLDFTCDIDTMADESFGGCTSLTTVTFHNKPTEISNKTFEECYALTTIRVPWAEGEVANAPWGAEDSSIIYGYTPS